MASTALGLSEKQKAMRSSGIGASEIAAVAGIHPTRKPIDIWLEKTGQADPFEGNAFTEWGQRIERVVAEAWAERHPEVSIFTPPTLRHRACTVAFATPDRVVVPRGRRSREVWMGLLEIKNVSSFQAKAFGEADDEIPEHFLCQVQWQLEVADLEEAELVPLIGGHDFRPYPIHRDREFGAMLIEAAERFWRDHVETGVPPPVDGSEAYQKALSRLHPKEKSGLLPADLAAAQLARRVAALRRASKTIEGRKVLAENELKARIGTSLGFDGVCTWKANKDGVEVDVDRVSFTLALALCEGAAADAETLVAQVTRQFTKPKPGARVLRISKE